MSSATGRAPAHELAPYKSLDNETLIRRIEAVRGDRLLQYNQFILDFTRIEGPPDVSKFEGIGYSIEEIGEVRALLEVKPGEEFNLSAEEMEALGELRSNTKGLDDAALIQTVNEALRAFLAERLREYQLGGVEAIAPYFVLLLQKRAAKTTGNSAAKPVNAQIPSLKMLRSDTSERR